MKKGAVAIVGLFFIFVVIYPVFRVFLRVGDLSLLWDPTILAITRMTAYQALCSALISVAVGVPLGLWVGRSRWAAALLAVPYGIPTVVAATAWVGILSRHGIFGAWAYSLKAVILAHVFYNAPWVALVTATVVQEQVSQRLEAAEVLGADRWSRFRFVKWPTLRFAVLSAFAQVVALSSMSFALVLILGGGPPVQTLETAIYSRIRYGSLDMPGAAALAVWEMLLTFLPWIIVLAFAKSAEVKSPRFQSPIRRDSKSALKIAAALFFTVPYFAIFAPNPAKVFFTLLSLFRGYELTRPLQSSLTLAICTGALTLLITLLSIYAARTGPRALRLPIQLAVALPSGISVLVLGLGIWLAYGNWFDPFSGSLSLLVLLQSAIFTPLAYRLLAPVAARARIESLETATLLGASPARAFWHVEFPRWKFPLLTTLALVMAGVVGEVAAVSLFYNENLVPLPLLVSRWMGQYRFADAQAVSALLFILCAATVFGVSVLGRTHEE